MYATCLFCHTALGANEVIEHFPVGRRLAFDAEKGRLWVVCRRCMRWNLTPLDERWEAIEECERIFRETRLRVSTDNIGMAKVREGLELVRIGKALRPEIAVWRYASVNDSRRRQAAIVGAASAGIGFGGVLLAGPALGIGFGWATWQLGSLANRTLHGLLKGAHRRIAITTDKGIIRIPRGRVGRTEIVRTDDGGWSLEIPHEYLAPTPISGRVAMQRLAVLIAAVNRDGVNKQAVEAGERILSEAGDADALLRRWAGVWSGLPGSEGGPRRRRARVDTAFRGPLTLGGLAEGNRVALEMAANEETERRAMEGELAMLEAAWREAEEIAAIADDMFLPPGVQEFIDRARGR